MNKILDDRKKPYRELYILNFLKRAKINYDTVNKKHATTEITKAMT